MENKAHALAAGAFVLAMTTLLVALAWWLTHDGAVRDFYDLSSRDAVSGLQPQAAVRFKGVPVGKVVNIGFDPKTPGNVLIRIAVDHSVPVTQSTYAMLGYQGVTGLAHVQLDNSGLSKEPLESDDGEPPRIPLRPSLMGRLTDQGAQLLVQVEEVTRRLNKLLGPENQQTMISTLTRAGEAAQSFHQLATDLRAVLGTSGSTGTGPGGDPASVAPRASVAEVLHSARGTLQSLQATSDATRQTMTDVGQTVKRLQDSGGPLDKLGQGADALVQGAGTLNASTLPRLNQVGEEAGRAVRQLGRTANALNDNPQSLLYGNGAIAPGPGEAGFTVPAAIPAR